MKTFFRTGTMRAIGKHCSVDTHKWFVSMMAICLLLFGCNQKKTLSNQGIPVIDLTQNYPEK